MEDFDGDDVSQDSLERIERRLAIEESLIEKIYADPSLSLDEREQLIREVLARTDSDEFWNEDDWNDDDALAILVRKLDPKGPKGRSGAAVHAPRPNDDNLGDTAGV